jgi:hypothetical protein
MDGRGAVAQGVCCCMARWCCGTSHGVIMGKAACRCGVGRCTGGVCGLDCVHHKLQELLAIKSYVQGSLQGGMCDKRGKGSAGVA